MGSQVMQRSKINFDALEWQSPLPGARFKAYRSGGKQIRLVEFTSDFIEPHWCEKGHIGLILEGSLEDPQITQMAQIENSHIGLILEGSLEVDFRGNAVIYEKYEETFAPRYIPRKKAQEKLDSVRRRETQLERLPRRVAKRNPSCRKDMLPRSGLLRDFTGSGTRCLSAQLLPFSRQQDSADRPFQSARNTPSEDWNLLRT